jgi:hypothetical protein
VESWEILSLDGVGGGKRSLVQPRIPSGLGDGNVPVILSV